MKKNDMRIIATVMGESDGQVRNAEVSSMLDYAFAQYGVNKLLNKDDIIKKVKINKAKTNELELVPTNDVSVLYKKTDEKINPNYKIEVNDIKLPIKKGDIVGKLYLKDENKVINEINLTVNKDVNKANILELFIKYLNNIISGNISF